MRALFYALLVRLVTSGRRHTPLVAQGDPWENASARDGVYAVLVARSPEGKDVAFSTKRLDVLAPDPLGARCYRTGSLTATLTAPDGSVREIETLEF